MTIYEGVLKKTLDRGARKAMELTILRLKTNLDRLAANFTVLDVTLKVFDAQIQNHRDASKTVGAFEKLFDLFHIAKI